MKQLKTRQICFFFLTFMPVIKIFMMPSIVSGISNEDGWLSVLLSVFVDFSILALLVFTFRKNDTDFFSVIEETFGKTISKIIMVIYALFFFVKALLPISEQRDFIDLTLYPVISVPITFIPFFFVLFYLCTKKLRVLGRLSDAVWVISIIGFILILALSFSNTDFTAMLPIGASGLKNIIKGSFASSVWFGDTLYFLFFIGEYEHKKGDGRKILLSYLLSSLLVIAFIIVFYSTFTSIAFRQRFALTEISKYTTVIYNLGRFDYIAIFLILFSSVIALSVPLYLSNRLLKKAFNVKKEWPFALGICVLIFIFFTFFNEYLASFEYFATNLFGYFYICIGVIFPIVLCIIKGVKNAKKRLQN